MALLNLQNISLSFGNIILFDGIELQIQKGEKISLLGRNGTGKSTLMKLIHGSIEPDAGSVIKESGIKSSLLSQEVPIDLAGSVYDIITSGIAHPDQLNHHMDGIEEQRSRHQIEMTLSKLSLDPNLIFENLSAGMKRRVLLGRALVNDPDILLLDEPTNHLDIEAIAWLEDFFSKYDRTIFFVTHDRTFLQKTANRIIELDRGKLFDWKCDYRTFQDRKEAWLESEETQNSLFDKKLAKEEVWIRKGIKARRTRNEGRVRALEKMRKERSERRNVQGKVNMEIQKTENSGKMILEATDITFGYGDHNLITGFSTRILRGDKIGIIGPNGCGKSTLIKLLLDELSPAAGTLKLGTRIETAYFDQLRDRLDTGKTVRENVSDGSAIITFNGRSRHVVGYLQDFLFAPDRIDMKVKDLSGGEKNRLMLAKLFTRPANLLVMDEPTNDLDIETIELLEELLLEYEGTLLLVSHDRTFLNNVVTSTFVFEGNAVVSEYAGGYDDWLRQRKSSDQPSARQVKTTREKKPAEKTKLSFREKKELESIPGEIDAHEIRIKDIHKQMSDPSFYRNSGPQVTDIKTELEVLERQVESLYLRWDELSSYENIS